MGIPRLLGYFRDAAPFKFRNVKPGDLCEIVVDGCALMFSLHKRVHCGEKYGCSISPKFGGQYPQLKEAYDEFFKTMKKCNIKVTVVFDGVDFVEDKRRTRDERKLGFLASIHSVVIKEKDDLSGLLSLLTKDVLFAVLRSHEIDFIVVDWDADRKIAQIANFKRCPVLSSDCDFYIYQLSKGYLPLESFECRGGALSGELYLYQDFLAAVPLRSADLLLGIPLLLGNEVYEATFKRSLPAVFGSGRNFVRVEDVVRYLSRFSCLEQCLQDLKSKLLARDRQALEHMLDKRRFVEKVYDATPTFESDPTAELLKQKDGRQIPDVLIGLHRRGLLADFVIEALFKSSVDSCICMEDTMQPPCLDAGLHICKTVYALIHCHSEQETVIHEAVRCFEYNRCHFNIVPRTVFPKDFVIDRPDSCSGYLDICDLPIAQRRGILLHCLSPATTPEAILIKLRKVPEQYHLLAVLTRHWCTTCRPSDLQIESLIKCFLLLQKGITSDVVGSDKRFRKNLHTDFKACRYHAFAQWQVICKHGSNLNNILHEPLTAMDVSQAYDGHLLHTIMLYSYDHRFSEEILVNPKQFQDYKKFYIL